MAQDAKKRNWTGKCHARDVAGIAAAQRVCWRLLDACCWFAVEPLPEERWLIAVREPDRAKLDEAVNKEPT